MIRNLGYALVVLFFMFSCAPRKQPGTAEIAGSLPKLAGKQIDLEVLDVDKTYLLDSAVINDEGVFSFRLNMDDAGFYILRTSEEDFIVLIVGENEKVYVQSEADTWNSVCTVEGSPGSMLLKSFEDFMRLQKQRVDSLAEIFYEYQGTDFFYKKKLELDSAYKNIFNDQRRYARDFINKHPASLACLIVINRKLGNNVVLDPEDDFLFFHRADSALMKVYPHNRHVLEFHRKVKETRLKIFDRYNADRKLQPGNKAPNIVVKDTSGNVISLKKLQGQNVLICFWAGWNAKSRRDNRKLVTLYPGMRKSNIEIFGVSLDENERVWKGALKLDHLPGTQGSDLKGHGSEVLKDYNLPDELPFYFLVDENQVILYKDDELDSVVHELGELFNSFAP
jgi:peroxiredoxin